MGDIAGAGLTGSSTPFHGHFVGGIAQRPRLGSTQSPSSRSTSRSNSFRGVAPDEESNKRTLLTLDKYAEREDEGYDDVFAADAEERFGCALVMTFRRQFFKLISFLLSYQI